LLHSIFCNKVICTPLLLEDSNIPPFAGAAVAFTTVASISGKPSLSKSPTLRGIKGDNFDVREGWENSREVIPGSREERGMLVKDLNKKMRYCSCSEPIPQCKMLTSPSGLRSK
jgi:hypothetical protein